MNKLFLLGLVIVQTVIGINGAPVVTGYLSEGHQGGHYQQGYGGQKIAPSAYGTHGGYGIQSAKIPDICGHHALAHGYGKLTHGLNAGYGHGLGGYGGQMSYAGHGQQSYGGHGHSGSLKGLGLGGYGGHLSHAGYGHGMSLKPAYGGGYGGHQSMSGHGISLKPLYSAGHGGHLSYGGAGYGPSKSVGGHGLLAYKNADEFDIENIGDPFQADELSFRDDHHSNAAKQPQSHGAPAKSHAIQHHQPSHSIPAPHSHATTHGKGHVKPDSHSKHRNSDALDEFDLENSMDSEAESDMVASPYAGGHAMYGGHSELGHASHAPVIGQKVLNYEALGPKTSCGSNLLVSCAPQVGQVPCIPTHAGHGGHYESHVSQPMHQMSHGYRADDSDKLEDSIKPQDDSQLIVQPQHLQENANIHQNQAPSQIQNDGQQFQANKREETIAAMKKAISQFKEQNNKP